LRCFVSFFTNSSSLADRSNGVLLDRLVGGLVVLWVSLEKRMLRCYSDSGHNPNGTRMGEVTRMIDAVLFFLEEMHKIHAATTNDR